jgi:hypothetical protein
MNTLKRLIAWITRCRHHDWTMLCNYWSTTQTNGFYIPIEEQCDKCGEYRHRILKADDLPNIPDWQPGKYPKTRIIQIKPRTIGTTAATTAKWNKLTPEEFNETGLHESFRDHSYWNEDGYLVTVAMHKAAIDNLKPND